MRHLLSICLLITGLPLLAQERVPTATLDRTQILIGEPAEITMRLSYRIDQGPAPHVLWPAVGDTLTSEVEVLHDTGVDTLMPDKEGAPYLLEQKRTLTITSWDSGYWAIPPFALVVDGDTQRTKALLLTVNTVPVDTAGAFRDIKDIVESPFDWKDWLRANWPYVAGGAAAVAILVLLVRYLIRRARRPRNTAPPEPPARPLSERTLEALAAIQARQLWQAGAVKQYHSEVTDLLRSYIEERYAVPAMELTSDELMSALRASAMPSEERSRLSNLLQLADLVKFAKYKALPAENEQLMANATAFVEATARRTNDTPAS